MVVEPPLRARAGSVDSSRSNIINPNRPKPMEQHKDEVEALFQLCVRMYERMEREGTWPWTTDAHGKTVLIEGHTPPERFDSSQG